jgi:hypothetical protein
VTNNFIEAVAPAKVVRRSTAEQAVVPMQKRIETLQRQRKPLAERVAKLDYEIASWQGIIDGLLGVKQEAASDG